MILALLSDVHANIQALEACLRDARKRGATRFAFLGDLVGYGADAAAVVRTIMRYAAEGAVVVKGNHDDAVERRTHGYMNDAAREAIDWARGTLGGEEKQFLSSLPLCVRSGECCFVHATARNPDGWSYIDSKSAALQSIDAAGVPYTFSGHVHEQRLFAHVGARRASAFEPRGGTAIPLGAHRSWLALVGSVGQPRDGSPAAGYALFDEDRALLTYFRIPYDHAAAARAIRKAGLPESLAFRVERGV